MCDACAQKPLISDICASCMQARRLRTEALLRDAIGAAGLEVVWVGVGGCDGGRGEGERGG